MSHMRIKINLYLASLIIAITVSYSVTVDAQTNPGGTTPKEKDGWKGTISWGYAENLAGDFAGSEVHLEAMRDICMKKLGATDIIGPGYYSRSANLGARLRNNRFWFHCGHSVDNFVGLYLGDPKAKTYEVFKLSDIPDNTQVEMVFIIACKSGQVDNGSVPREIATKLGCKVYIGTNLSSETQRARSSNSFGYIGETWLVESDDKYEVVGMENNPYRLIKAAEVLQVRKRVVKQCSSKTFRLAPEDFPILGDETFILDTQP